MQSLENRRPSSGVSRMAVTGEFAEVVADAARANGVSEILVSSSREELAKFIAAHMPKVVLLKASRRLELEKVIPLLVDELNALSSAIPSA